MSQNTSPQLKHKDSAAIFIGGHSRTGTTLMHGQICKSPDTHSVTKECSYFRALVEACELGSRWFTVHTDDYFDSEEAFFNFHQGLLEQYFQHVSDRFGAGRMVQKEPRLTPYFPEVAVLMPQARFVFMVRDIRDIIASQTTRLAKTDTPFDVAAEISRLVTTHQRIDSARHILRDRLLFVRYEGLAQRPIETLQAIFRFLDLSWTDSMNDTRWTTKRPRLTGPASMLDGLAISPRAIGRYRTVLSQDLIEEFERERANVKQTIGFDCYVEPDTPPEALDLVFRFASGGLGFEPADDLLPDTQSEPETKRVAQ